MTGAAPRRRKRLVSNGGVEMFEFRIVQYFDTDGGQWTSWEVTTPEGTPEPHDHEVLGVIEKAKAEVIKWYASIDPEEPQ